MKYLAMLSLLFCISAFSADVVVAPKIAVDTTVTPPTITITLTIDGTKPVAAMQAAIAATTKANADALAKDPNAPQKSVQDAGQSAFVSAMIPALYKLVEDTQNGVGKTDAEVAAKAAADKAAADAAAAAQIALRPQVTIK